MQQKELKWTWAMFTRSYKLYTQPKTPMQWKQSKEQPYAPPIS